MYSTNMLLLEIENGSFLPTLDVKHLSGSVKRISCRWQENSNGLPNEETARTKAV
jgi:hypothetical protein